MTEKIAKAATDLVKPGVFAVLAILTSDGDTVLRPIGGDWNA
jgi:hypothetical protein